MKVIAHRGACREALENSWEAFQKAIEVKADRIEFDVQPTLDGELAIMHDESLARTCEGEDYDLAALTRKQLQAFRLKNGEAIPFLDECLTRLRDKIELNIEIKSKSIDSADKVAQMILKRGKGAGIIVSSFHPDVLSFLAKNYKGIELAFLFEAKNALETRDFQQIEHYMHATNISIFHPDAMLVSESMINWTKANNWKVYPYVSNTIENPEILWPFLYELGIDGLCTNYPRELKAWLLTKK